MKSRYLHASRFLHTLKFSLHATHFGENEEEGGTGQREKSRKQMSSNEKLHTRKDVLTHLCEPPQIRTFQQREGKEGKSSAARIYSAKRGPDQMPRSMKGRQPSKVAKHANPWGRFWPWHVRQIRVCSKHEGGLTENSTVLIKSLYGNLEVIDTEESGCQEEYISCDIREWGETPPKSTHTNLDEIISLQASSKGE